MRKFKKCSIFFFQVKAYFDWTNNLAKENSLMSFLNLLLVKGMLKSLSNKLAILNKAIAVGKH